MSVAWKSEKGKDLKKLADKLTMNGLEVGNYCKHFTDFRAE